MSKYVVHMGYTSLTVDVCMFTVYRHINVDGSEHVFSYGDIHIFIYRYF